MNENLVKALSAAFESGGALARFSDAGASSADAHDATALRKLRDHLNLMLTVLTALERRHRVSSAPLLTAEAFTAAAKYEIENERDVMNLRTLAGRFCEYATAQAESNLWTKESTLTAIEQIAAATNARLDREIRDLMRGIAL